MHEVADATIAWFPILMALVWLIIAFLFYKRGRRAEQRNETEQE
jgi:hypothetical protein